MAKKEASGPVGHMSDRPPASWQQALDDGRYLAAHYSDPAEAIGCKIQAVLNVASFGANLAFPMPHGPFGKPPTAAHSEQVEAAVTELMSKCPECCPAEAAAAPVGAFDWMTALTFLLKFLELLRQQAEGAK